jgi:glycosyltransferase involved in cell wall biosynthesis
MKILRVISSVDRANGGPINGLINSSVELIAKGHEIDVLCLDDPNANFIKELPFNVYAFKGFIGGLKYSAEFANWLDDNVQSYDIIIIHGIWQYHAYATAKSCTKANVPYVLFTHGMLDPWFNEKFKLKALKKKVYWRFLEKLTVNNANAVLFTSEEEKVLARRSFSPYSPLETVVAYGSPTPKIEKEQAVTAFYNASPKLEGQRFVLFLSRIHTKKGIDLLIDAMAEVSHDFILAIAGPGDVDLIRKLNLQIQERGLGSRVEWLGMLQGEQKWGAFYAADAFILPSHQENFGIVVAEALSTATPVLITNKVNIWREIDAAGAGFVENDDVDGIKELLNRWFELTTKEKLVMAVNAKACYQYNFSIESAVTDLEKVLINVINTMSKNEE